VNLDLCNSQRVWSRDLTLRHLVTTDWVVTCNFSMSIHPSSQDQSIEFPLLDHPNSERDISYPVSASSLLATSNAAKSPANPYKTLSAPIDRIIGPFVRPGYGLQISGPPGTYLEHLLIGLIKSVTSDGKEVMVVGMSHAFP
jgi:hypothetical protein